jgi:lipopolysaccharide export system protein LptA
VAEKLEAREKQTDTGVEVKHTHNEVTITKGKDEIHVDSHVFTLYQAGEVAASEDFTRDTFENALDKVSRPVKGKYAHVPYSSEDLIREKRTEAELEDR